MRSDPRHRARPRRGKRKSRSAAGRTCTGDVMRVAVLAAGHYCQATGETDPFPTLKLTPFLIRYFIGQREPATPASAQSHPKLHDAEWDRISHRFEVLARAIQPSSSVAIDSSRLGS